MGRGQGAKRNAISSLRDVTGRAARSLAARQSRSLFRDGALAWSTDDQPAAQALFAQAAAADPANADALLGLQFYAPLDLDICRRLHETRGRIGAHQRRPRIGVHGRCFPMQFHSVDVVDAPDTALAYAAALAAAGRHADAQALLNEQAGETDHRLDLALRSRIAYDLGDYAMTVSMTRPLLDDRRLGDDPALLHAAALLFDGRPDLGRDLLVNCRLTSASAAARAWATYLLALSHQHAGRHQHAYALLEDLHSANPGYLDVAARIAALQDPDLADPLSAPTDPFEAIAQMFDHGAPADDPTIPDNQ